MNIAIFASGSGSNAENIIRYFSTKENAADFSFHILCNNPKAYVLHRAEYLGVPTTCFSRKEFAEGEKILEFLVQNDIKFIVLAGFMMKIPDNILQKFPEKIINIHPALLPKFGGKGMYGHHVHEAVAAAHETKSGISIHFVNSHYDAGEIIFQAECTVLPTDTPDDIAAKVHELEMANFPRVIENVIQKTKFE